jgi:hypothetical protein
MKNFQVKFKTLVAKNSNPNVPRGGRGLNHCGMSKEEAFSISTMGNRRRVISSFLYCFDNFAYGCSLIGDGMGAYMQYKVTTSVCSFFKFQFRRNPVYHFRMQFPKLFQVTILLSSYFMGFLLQTTLSSFKKPETIVSRRFSDFLGLHERLSAKFLVQGKVVPPAPEKSVLGQWPVNFITTVPGYVS